MSNPTQERISLLQNKIQGQRSFIDDALARAAAEDRDLNEVETQNLTDAHENVARMTEELDRLVKFSDSVAAAEALAPVARTSAPIFTAPRAAAPMSLGEEFVTSEAFRGYEGRGTSGTLTVDAYAWETRAVGPDPLLTTTKPGSDLLPHNQVAAGPEHFLDFPLLSMAGRIALTSSSVDWVTTTDASGVDVVAEGAKKPPVVWSTNVVTYTLKTYAGWFKFSRQAVQDIPQLRSIIDGKLRRALDVKLAADAAAALMAGFSGANTSTGGAGSKMADQLRTGIGVLQGRGVNPNAILLNPADHAALDIAMLGSTMLGPVVRPQYWGLPVYAVNDVPAKTAIIGNISQGLTWFSKGGIDLFVTDSDVSETGSGGTTVTSDFQRNILTALLETRGVFAVTDTQVLQKVTVA
jgi:HK97 family phage major capsid protein